MILTPQVLFAPSSDGSRIHSKWRRCQQNNVCLLSSLFIRTIRVLLWSKGNGEGNLRTENHLPEEPFRGIKKIFKKIDFLKI